MKWGTCFKSQGVNSLPNIIIFMKEDSLHPNIMDQKKKKTRILGKQATCKDMTRSTICVRCDTSLQDYKAYIQQCNMQSYATYQYNVHTFSVSDQHYLQYTATVCTSRSSSSISILPEMEKKRITCSWKIRLSDKHLLSFKQNVKNYSSLDLIEFIFS